MDRRHLLTRTAAGLALLPAGALLHGCAPSQPAPVPPLDPSLVRRRGGTDPLAPDVRADLGMVRLVDRITWGVSESTVRRLLAVGADRWIEGQLRPPAMPPVLPGPVQARIDAMQISQQPLDRLVFALERQRRSAGTEPDDDARRAYQQALTRLGREAMERLLLRAMYSPHQLHEQMTWFWLNHFSVHLGKANLRAMVGDYESRAIRPFALGRFRDLLHAVVRHPAMLRYLDNERNAAGRGNENFARELMELHTLGVDGGYTQADVQALARVLTGLGIAGSDEPPRMRAGSGAFYLRDGLFEFHPDRHDWGDKVLLGHVFRGRGLAEVDEVLDLLARHPATARHVCRRLAAFMVGEAPAPLVDAMAHAFLRTDGDIAMVLSVLFRMPEFEASLGRQFKDPTHWLLSSMRLAYDERPILNPGPLLGWLSRLGQLPFNRQTPDGYPMDDAAWSSPAQMTARFEIARAIGSGPAGLFRSDDPQPVERPDFPRLANGLYHRGIAPGLGEPTLTALAQAGSQQEWNTLLLSSPEFMRR